MDAGLGRCTVCWWLDDSVARCEVVGCLRPGDYAVEMGTSGEGPEFTTILRHAVLCGEHALLGGLALIPQDES